MRKIYLAMLTLASFKISSQSFDIYGPKPFQQVLENNFSTSWTPTALPAVQNLKYVVLLDAGSTSTAVMLANTDRFKLNVNSIDSVNGAGATYGSLLRSIFQLVDVNTSDSIPLANKYFLRPLLHSYHALNSSGDSATISDAGTYYINEADSNGYVVVEFSGSADSVNILASSRYYYNAVSDSIEELTSWTPKWLKIQGSAIVYTASQANASSFFLGDVNGLINIEVQKGSDFNPISINWQENDFAAVPDSLWKYEQSQFYGNFLMDVDTVIQYQFGSTTAANDSAIAALDAIEDSLIAQGDSLRYDKSVYLEFRNTLLSQKFAATDIFNSRFGESTVAYVYFTNAEDASGTHHPFMVIASHNASSGPNFLIDVAKPPGDGINPYPIATITRNAVLELKLVKIPLKDYGLISALEDNDLSAYGTLAQDAGLTSANFSVFNYCSTSSCGIAADGVVIYPSQNNNLRQAAEEAEITCTGIHVGQGMGLHYHADGHSFNNNGIDLYNLTDFSSKNHPPLIGFAYDGIALFGKYETSYSSMNGYSIALDAFGGHDHDGFGYHYHAFNTTYYADSLGTQVGPVTAHILLTGAWKGNVNEIPGLLEVSTSQLKDDSIAQYAGGSATQPPPLGINNINEQEANAVIIYPNPGNGSFKVITKELCKFTLIDPLGKIIFTKQSENKETSFELKTSAKGVYILKIEGVNSFYTRKIIIQ